MEYFSDADEKIVEAAINAEFPGYHFSFMEDPDDASVIFVRLYDVDESCIASFKKRLRHVLREEIGDMRADLIASVVSSEDTQKYYAEYLRAEVQVAEDEIDLLLGNSKKEAAGWRLPKNRRCVRWDTPDTLANAKMELDNGYRLAA